MFFTGLIAKLSASLFPGQLLIQIKQLTILKELKLMILKIKDILV